MNLSLLNHILEAFQKDQPIVRALVIQSSGSVPRSAGAAMLVRTDGSISGTVGGGLVEAASREAALEVLAKRQGRECQFDLTGSDAAKLGMICGGRVRVLLDYLEPEKTSRALIKEVRDALMKRGSVLLLSELDPQGGVSGRCLFPAQEQERAESYLGPELGGALQKGAKLPYPIEANGRRVLVEPLSPAAMLYLMGAGHVAQATGHVAALVGFNLIVLDDREEFANPERFPQAQEIIVIPDYDHGLPNPMGPDDYVVITTRGHLHDQEALAQALSAGPGYLGMIGSRRKREAIYQNLTDAGVPKQSLDRVHSPIGLAIGADTPEEIAVSIVSQLIAHRSGCLDH
jgi:xanthine dehydrogenase accessory factor